MLKLHLAVALHALSLAGSLLEALMEQLLQAVQTIGAQEVAGR